MGKIRYPLLEFDKVTVIQGGNKKALDAISIKIQEGEHIAILGPNGAGKSSFIKTITREYYPEPGNGAHACRILGQETWNIFELRYMLGIVSSDLQYTCTKDITGMDEVLSGFFGSIGLYREHITDRMKRQAAKVVDFLELGHLKDRKMNEMSQGEARRFLIGRALVHDPKALILDEPANSLDLHALHKFSDILRKIARKGTSIILVTQNLSDIIPEIDRVVLMKNGRICQEGPKESILTDKNISRLFGTSVEIRKKDGYYYALRA